MYDFRFFWKSLLQENKTDQKGCWFWHNWILDRSQQLVKFLVPHARMSRFESPADRTPLQCKLVVNSLPQYCTKKSILGPHATLFKQGYLSTSRPIPKTNKGIILAYKNHQISVHCCLQSHHATKKVNIQKERRNHLHTEWLLPRLLCCKNNNKTSLYQH